MKLCRTCNEAVSASRRKDAVYCSEICANRKRNREYYDPERSKNKQVRYRLRHPEQYMVSKVKNRAKRSGIEFNIDKSDLFIPIVCPVLGITLATVVDNIGSGYHENSPSIDRIDNGKGYIKGNVRVISARANLLKNNATVEELRLILLDLENIHA